MKRTTRRKSDRSAGRGRVRISTTITEATDAELNRLARASSVTRSAMARECITDAVARGLTIATTKSHAGKVIEYPLGNPANPTARAADDTAS
jgi:hypothetical protein